MYTQAGQHGAVLRSLTYSAAVDQESVWKFDADVNIHRSIYVRECDWDRRGHCLTENALLDLRTGCLDFFILKEKKLKGNFPFCFPFSVYTFKVIVSNLQISNLYVYVFFD